MLRKHRTLHPFLSVVLVSVLALLGTARAASPKSRTETQKIEALIGIVDRMKNAVFVRNGNTYDGPHAAKHLREKWEWKKDEIKTARDFIRVAGTGSSQSGQPYLIRFRNGREVKCGDFLMGELKKIERDGRT